MAFHIELELSLENKIKSTLQPVDKCAVFLTVLLGKALSGKFRSIAQWTIHKPEYVSSSKRTNMYPSGLRQI